MKHSGQDSEDLRRALLDDVYAGAFAGGTPAMLQEEDQIRKADDQDLEKLAQQHGLK